MAERFFLSLPCKGRVASEGERRGVTMQTPTRRRRFRVIGHPPPFRERDKEIRQKQNA